MPECRGSGRLTRSQAVLNEYTLAVAYKVEGRKIVRTDAIRNMTHDLQELNGTLIQIERRLSEISGYASAKSEMREMLDGVRREVRIAESTRQIMSDSADTSDEPIAKVIYPGGVNPSGAHVVSESVTISSPPFSALVFPRWLGTMSDANSNL